MALPDWLVDLRRSEVVRKVQRDSRTSGDILLGVHRDRIFFEVIGGGQAAFDEPWTDVSGDLPVVLSGAEKVLLYAFFNQKGHLEELVAGLNMLVANAELEDLLVIDLGCGPFTGGLALGAVWGAERSFTYIGVDMSVEMRALGERLATAAADNGNLGTRERYWCSSLAELDWKRVAGWQPVLVIVSYLLASPTLDPTALVSELNQLLKRVGHGEVVLFYTNSVREDANRHFQEFRAELEAIGFECVANQNGSITVDSFGGSRTRELRYALFRRPRRDTLQLGED